MFIMFMGLPGSGKSTKALEMYETYTYLNIPATYISSDKVRMDVFGVEFHPDLEIWIWGYIERLVKAKLDHKDQIVILDSTNLTKTGRETFLRFARARGHETVGVYMSTPLHTCMERIANRERKVPKDVLERMEKSRTMPDEIEFTKLIVF